MRRSAERYRYFCSLSLVSLPFSLHSITHVNTMYFFLSPSLSPLSPPYPLPLLFILSYSTSFLATLPPSLSHSRPPLSLLQVIHDVSLSPDGAVLATASEDGHLKFWQVDWNLEEGEQSKCLHDFQPHKGAPVTRLIFCDNHLSQDPAAQFWRFLLTAANDNTEVKVWCTVSWKCLQTFRLACKRLGQV